MEGAIELNAEQVAAWEQGWKRYEAVRKMNTREFHDLRLRSLFGEASFDELVDSVEASS